jgi:hypothetical protein
MIWVARDGAECSSADEKKLYRTGIACFFEEEPFATESQEWVDHGETHCIIPKNIDDLLFPSLTFEDGAIQIKIERVK